jgi:ABC-type ATPase involved in cell division
VATHDVHLIERFDLRRVTLEHGRVTGDEAQPFNG